jgi:hypothetical protein
VLSGGSDRLPTLGSASATSGVLQLGDAGGARNQTLAGLVVASGSGSANAVVGGNATTSTLTINGTYDVSYSGFLGGPGANQTRAGCSPETRRMHAVAAFCHFSA